MQKIKEDKRLNIYEIVKQLRMQRVKMVQTPGQYIYLYKCVYELMKKEKSWTQRVLGKYHLSVLLNIPRFRLLGLFNRKVNKTT